MFPKDHLNIYSHSFNPRICIFVRAKRAILLKKSIKTTWSLGSDPRTFLVPNCVHRYFLSLYFLMDQKVVNKRVAKRKRKLLLSPIFFTFSKLSCTVWMDFANHDKKLHQQNIFLSLSFDHIRRHMLLTLINSGFYPALHSVFLRNILELFRIGLVILS